MEQANIHNITTDRIFDLSELGMLKVSGSGAEKLLQGQLSCDITAIAPSSGIMGAHCNPQGRIISLFYAARIANVFYLIMPKNIMVIAASALKKYAPFFKAELQDASSEYHLIGMIITSNTAPASTGFAAVIKLPSTLNRYILFAPELNTSIKPASYEEWKLFDMHDGIPAIYAETSGEFLPHDLNLPELNAVNFNKGCFTGQEIIARMHYRGKPKNHLYRGLANDTLTPGTLLFAEEKPAGTIIDCSQTVYNNQYAVLFTSSETTVANQQLRTKLGRIIAIQKSE